MEQYIHQLKEIMGFQLERFTRIKDKQFDAKPNPEKWSKKEILGHLIDSAQNNIQRFIRTQYETEFFIQYDQDEWVRLNNYHHYAPQQLVELWMLSNFQILNIWKIMPEENMQKTCNTPAGMMSIEELAADYIKHLQHHLAQINA